MDEKIVHKSLYSFFLDDNWIIDNGMHNAPSADGQVTSTEVLAADDVGPGEATSNGDLQEEKID